MIISLFMETPATEHSCRRRAERDERKRNKDEQHRSA
jgi:hypothetical protein